MTAIGPSTIAIGALTLGVVDSFGVEWGIDSLTGWGGTGSSLSVTQKPRDHGGWASEAFLTPRNLAVKGWIRVGAANALQAAKDTLDAAVSILPTAFTVTEQSNTSRTCLAQRNDIIVWGDEADLWTSYSLQMVAPDPRRYGPTVTAGPVGPPSSTGGLTFALTFPLVFAATVTSGVCTINNPGDVVAPCIATITGPTIGASIAHTWTGSLGSGAETWATNLTLGSSEFLTIGPENDQVEAQGQATRIGSVTSRAYLRLWPGENDFIYNGSGGTLSVTGAQGAWQ